MESSNRRAVEALVGGKVDWMVQHPQTPRLRYWDFSPTLALEGELVDCDAHSRLVMVILAMLIAGLGAGGGAPKANGTGTYKLDSTT
eukprot:54912-Amorphochlora_amoeboformis.AAC.1